MAFIVNVKPNQIPNKQRKIRNENLKKYIKKSQPNF